MEDLSLIDRNNLDIHELWHLSKDLALSDIVGVTLHPDLQIVPSDVDEISDYYGETDIMNYMPPELLEKIMSFLDVVDVLRMRAQKWDYKVLIDNKEPLWRRALEKGMILCQYKYLFQKLYIIIF